MAKKKIDLSDIKEKSLEETTTFENLMTRSERKKRNKEKIDDIEEMINEKRKMTEDLTKTVKEAKKKEEKIMNKNEKKKELKNFFSEEDINYVKSKRKSKLNDKKEKNNEISEGKTKEIDIKKMKNSNDIEELLSKTQILELTRKMKFNFDDVTKENIEKKKKGFSLLNIIGITNLICIGFYIYLIVFSSYQDNETNYLIAGCLIIALVLFFGISVIAGKKIRKIFNVVNIFAIMCFITFSIYIFLK